MNKLLFLLLSCIVAQCSVNAMERTYPLHEAVVKGNVAQVAALLDAGADVNQQDIAGDTALHLAPTQEIARLLLDRNAMVNQQNIFDGTPVYHAICYNKPDIVRLLLERGAFIDQKDRDLTRPTLLYTFGYRELLVALYGQGIRGSAPVDRACMVWGMPIDANMTGDTRAIPAIIDSYIARLGGIVQFKDASHVLAATMPPLKIAARIGNREIAELLRSWPIVVSGSRAGRLAFCMAMHRRVGADSPANVLHQYLFQEICSYLRPSVLIDDDEAVASYRRIYEQQQRQTQGWCTIS
jgi:ankyrin repeat protein